MDFLDFVDVQSLFTKYVENGGILMWVLIPCSLIMLGTIFQGVITLRRGRVLPRWILRGAAQAQGEAGRGVFLKKVGVHGSPLARILWLTLKEEGGEGRPAGRPALQARLEEAIITVSDKMYDLVGVLSTIYTVGPLLGLIGTILGLMDTFHTYGADANPSIKILSEGVQKALVTTFWGLSMAIPAFVAGQWMQKKIRGYERDLFPEAAWQVIDALDAAKPAPGEPAPEDAGEDTVLRALIKSRPALELESKA